MSNVNPIPEGFSTLTPYLIVKGAKEAIEFYKKALGASERLRMEVPGKGLIAHAELQIGDSRIMLADEHPEMGAQSPKTLGGSPVHLLLYVESVDQWSDRAVKAGMSVKRPIENQFYGDRTGTLEDPYGYQWTIATHVEDVSPEEMRKRAQQKFGA